MSKVISIQKFVWLIDTIRRARYITLEDISEEWRNCSLNETGEGIPRTTFNRFRQKIELEFGVYIGCKKIGSEWLYYIEEEYELESNNLHQWLMDTLSIGNLLSSSKKLHSRILMDEIPVGGQVLSELIKAMEKGLKVNFVYRHFGRESSKAVEGAPYCLKAFRRRWYVVMQTPDHEDPAVYSLDRILKLSLTKTAFTLPDDFDGQHFFKDSFGVFASKEFKAQFIKIKVMGLQRDYIRALPLHHSQEEIERHSGWSVFRFYLRPTFDFRQEVLSHGASMEVLQPESFRKEIEHEISLLSKAYDTIFSKNVR